MTTARLTAFTSRVPARVADAVAVAALGLAALAAGCGSGAPIVCTHGGKGYAAGARFPADDGCNTCTCAAGGQIACTEIGCLPRDGGGGDLAGTDLGVVTDAGAMTCAFDATFAYGLQGGFVAYVDTVTLSPGMSYQYVRHQQGGGGSDLTCAPALPACGDLARLDVSDIMRDIAHADVQAALSLASPPLYGRDDRPVDGQIFVVTRAVGRGVQVGSDCRPTDVGCTAPPAGIRELVDDLKALDRQQLMDPSCVAAGLAR